MAHVRIISTTIKVPVEKAYDTLRIDPRTLANGPLAWLTAFTEHRRAGSPILR